MAWQRIGKRTYFVTSRAIAAALSAVDLIGEITAGTLIKKNRSIDAANVKKILISRPDHLGDVLMCTALLPVLKELYPHAEIHLMVGRWGRDLINTNPDIKKIVVFDHYYLDRSDKPFLVKVANMLRQLPSVVAEIRKERYDIGFDLKPFFGNTNVLMWLGGVNYRVGYDSAGFGFLLNKTGRFSFQKHFIENMIELVTDSGTVPERSSVAMHCEIPADVHKKIRDEVARVRRRKYLVVINPGSGSGRRRLADSVWTEVVNTLLGSHDTDIIFAGTEAEKDSIDRVTTATGNRAINMAGAWTIKEFTALASCADVMVCLESFSAHVAAAVEVPAVVVHAGIQDTVLWKPWGNNIVTVTHATSCSPCWHSKGCDDMQCLNQISGTEIVGAIDRLLGGARVQGTKHITRAND